jgi:hypothetical protein
MKCGNDPNAELTPGDLAVVDWYREWLAWSKTPEAERGPEPVSPNPWAINAAAHAQTTRCEQRPTHEG